VKKSLGIITIVITLDLIVSAIFLKNTILWNNNDWENKYWRIESNIYHHDLLPNIDVVEKWGETHQKRILTNSLGFRDFSRKKVVKISDKKRILLVGDSFIEGTGYDYEHTIGGLIQNKLGNKYEVLNSAVGSYSPSIYYSKINYFISKGYKFDQALVFLDVSDIYDELFIKYDSNESIIVERKAKRQSKIKTKIYSLGNFLRDNTLSFRTMYLISDKTEIYKNFLKLKYKASKLYNKKFFSTTVDDVMFYRMTHIDRGYWTFSEEKFQEVKKGLKKSDYYLKKLFSLLKENSIKSHLVIYPWPTQIEFGDTKHINYWKKFALENRINLIDLYDEFPSDTPRDFIFDNFIYGDIHWNKKGTNIVFNALFKKIKFQ
jgi:hypothetical protein